MHKFLFFVILSSCVALDLPVEYHQLQDAGEDVSEESVFYSFEVSEPDSGYPDSGVQADAGVVCNHPRLRALEVDSRCSCDGAKANVDLALQRLLTYNVYVAPLDEFYSIFANVSVRVVYDPSNSFGGVYYSWFDQVVISSSMDGLAHEFIHAIEDYRGTLDPAGSHRGWDQNQAYTGAMQSYISNRNYVTCN